MSKSVITIDTGRQHLVVRLESGLTGKLVARCNDPEEARRIAHALDPDHHDEEPTDG